MIRTKRSEDPKTYLPVGHKYALIVLPSRQATSSTPLIVDVGDGHFASAYLPVAVPKHWREWLGSLRMHTIEEASEYLAVTRPSTTLEILDAENPTLRFAAHRFYFGILVSCPFFGHDEGVSLTGSVYQDGTADVRSSGSYDAVYQNPGAPQISLSEAQLRTARIIADAMEQLSGRGEGDRTWRVVHTYYAGMRAAEAAIRLHQFVRCIEGFVHPERNKIRAQFIKRGLLFVDGDENDLLNDLSNIRRGVEHLHGALTRINGSSTEERTLKLFFGAFLAQEIARSCLHKLFTRREVQEHFHNDLAIDHFWKDLDSDDRQEIWGDPVPMRSLRRAFDRDAAHSRIRFE